MMHRLRSFPNTGRQAGPCLACGTVAAAQLTVVDRNRAVTHDVFDYALCPSCGLWFLLAVPEDLGCYYQEEYYRTPSLPALAATARREHYQVELLLRAVAPPGRLVEIGGSWGVFAAQAREAGFQVHVLEMDARCCEYLRDCVDVTATCTSRPADVLAAMPQSRAIVMWQVLEHLPDPLAVLDAAAANLEVGGVLLVATPNPGSLGMRLMGRQWPHLDAPRHVTLVSPDLLRRWTADRGLDPVFTVDTDIGARRWNRFAWQRLLLNQVRTRVAAPPLLVAGAVISAAVSPWENRPGRGSSYTAVFRKAASS